MSADTGSLLNIFNPAKFFGKNDQRVTKLKVSNGALLHIDSEDLSGSPTWLGNDTMEICDRYCAITSRLYIYQMIVGGTIRVPNVQIDSISFDFSDSGLVNAQSGGFKSTCGKGKITYNKHYILIS